MAGPAEVSIGAPGHGGTGVLDDLRDATRWQAVASGEAELKLSTRIGPRGSALCLDFDFKGGGGFVVARREVELTLPEAFAFSFRIGGDAPRNTVEFKLADPGGANVWRWQQADFGFTAEPRAIVLGPRDIGFAWGPAGGGAPRRVGAIEVVISAGPGGKGRVWLEDLRMEDQTNAKPPGVSSSSAGRGCRVAGLLDGGTARAWRPAPADRSPWVVIDFHGPRDCGGLVIDWADAAASRGLAIDRSDDGRHWRALRVMSNYEGRRSFIPLEGADGRFLRFRLRGARDAVAMRAIEVKPWDFSLTTIDFLHAVAGASPRGRHPRHLLREQSYWTCAGSPDSRSCALINEEGLVEMNRGSFTLEPLLEVGGRLITWADVRGDVRLEDGMLPVPTATWSLAGLGLETTVFANGRGTRVLRQVRYRLTHRGGRARKVSLWVALRPYQVTPSWQAWQGLGGLARIDRIAWRQGAVCVNDCEWVVPGERPAAFGACRFDEGVITDRIAAGVPPGGRSARDASGLVSAALRFDLVLGPGETRDVYLAVPDAAWSAQLGSAGLKAWRSGCGPESFEHALATMRRRITRVRFDLPEGMAREAAATFHTAAGQILINRDGPALQPGPRRYTRSWIRDGAIMGAALLKAGDVTAMAAFVRWYANHQRPDGFVPCCVDRHGPDPVVEHDSHGQLVFAVMESFRFDGDRDRLAALWPQVRKAAMFLCRLRKSRLTAKYLRGPLADRRGLLPESASHEGYLAHPVHSYWDDFWGWRGLKDAASIASHLGRRADAVRFAEEADELGEAIRASMRRVIRSRGLSHVPGSVEWADFDPTATANAVSFLQAGHLLPAGPLAAMFDHYLRDFRRKHGGGMPWNNYTAYEIRIIGALVRLGRRDDALELLTFFLGDRRPRVWNQWPEISWRDPRSPGHLGDLPHTWIAAEYLLVFASLFAFEREEDDAVVIAAGVDPRWLDDAAGITVAGLPLWQGSLDLKLRRDAEGVLHLELGGTMNVPSGGFILRPPLERSIRGITCNGRRMRIDEGSQKKRREPRIREFPAVIRLES
jgi:F5/8 type C domain